MSEFIIQEAEVENDDKLVFNDDDDYDQEIFNEVFNDFIDDETKFLD